MKIIILLMIGILFFISYYLNKKRISIKQNRFIEREIFTIDEIFQRFYANSNFHKENVSYLWNKVAEILKLEAGRLRPTDRFDVELGYVKGFPIIDEMEDLDYFYKSEWKRLKRLGPPLKIYTLDEFIYILSK